MTGVLTKIPVRKALREKGKSICVIAAVFFTTVLFVTVFATLLFVFDAAEEMLRASSPMLADASFVVTQEEYERIKVSRRVKDAGLGIRLAETMEPSGAGGIQLFCFEDRMAQWMRYNPVKGRMPQSAHEIVVSDQYLRDRGLVSEADWPHETASEAGCRIEMTYYIEEKEYSDFFTVVGVYERAAQPLHVVLTSDDFREEVFEDLRQRGIDPKNATYQIAGVMFSSHGNVRRLASMLAEEEGLDMQDGTFFLNEVSPFDGMSAGTWAAIFGILFFIMMMGYLFISNIFQISLSRDARFYGRLSTNGITGKEIEGLIRRQNNLLFLLAAFPALPVAYAFCRTALPGILNAGTSLQIQRKGNGWIFVLSLTFSYATVKLSERKPMKLAGKASPIELKRYTGKIRPVKAADEKDCLRKLAVRCFANSKAKVLKVWVSIALSILLAGIFYTMAAGFDVEEYVKGDIDADYIFARKPVFTSPGLNPITYERTMEEDIAVYKEFPGVKAHGGDSTSWICLEPSEEVWEHFVNIAGENAYDTPGKMWTDVYGLDDMLLQKLKPIRGEINLELLHSGKYVLLNPILSDGNTENAACYEPGDQVTISFRSGEEGIYKVMAVVEGLPYSLSLPGQNYAGSLYLPMKEWREKEKREGYYLYAFDVEEGFHEMWDEALENRPAGEGGSGGGHLAFRSAKTAARDAEEYIGGLKLAGFVLSMILLSMGILNFINCTAAGIYSRSREFAILQSMGTKESEIRKMLAKEGMLYMAGGFVSGILLAVPGVWFLIENLLRQPYIKYEIYPGIYLVFAMVGCAAAVLVPWTAYGLMDRKENFLDRIRGC